MIASIPLLHLLLLLLLLLFSNGNAQLRPTLSGILESCGVWDVKYLVDVVLLGNDNGMPQLQSALQMSLDEEASQMLLTSSSNIGGGIRPNINYRVEAGPVRLARNLSEVVWAFANNPSSSAEALRLVPHTAVSRQLSEHVRRTCRAPSHDVTTPHHL